ncbi:Type 1 glutamine amidotransferase-like domain-containing protein [Candidatus Nomurabacteria bacterium]|uniref:Type 1 glutamine amidotransferase-like domain-containing protein n=1 Tax=candidate division WWE3 bacterium TaxID=2053526 RepID=A0A955E023_UNCKA|nr:Type 1 glutamine amidotransferase-like domain-containing protein [candidate division WWE3 bacterium]MCB9823393.1 Type 1 glutamine amidotransferase-like domain-containing protein [Candidatus Nomurabacteria bacterium]MCB9827675.1 Type 1 glutamine amidotransferase-like domain-containing protein [Candidatus Nomurabacteria bacterium]HXK52840.1 Type 1 glutamine amidotransferase-like domain-containing protein [bacterium]
MKLILGGGGDENTSIQSHKRFFDLLKNSRKVLYIPIAILSDKYTPEGCLSWFSGAFKNMGDLDIEMVTRFEDIDSDLGKYAGIYIGGGNTYKLLHEMKKSGIDERLDTYKGVVYGGSAGAIIFGKDISTAEHADINNVGLKDISGLNYLKGYNLWCHYKEEDIPLIDRLVEKGQKIISIEEDSAIYINNTHIIQSIGNNVRIHIQGKDTFKLLPKEQFELLPR